MLLVRSLGAFGILPFRVVGSSLTVGLSKTEGLRLKASDRS